MKMLMVTELSSRRMVMINVSQILKISRWESEYSRLAGTEITFIGERNPLIVEQSVKDILFACNDA
jgi:hypothetical protein